jgi:hypothetical protein
MDPIIQDEMLALNRALESTVAAVSAKSQEETVCHALYQQVLGRGCAYEVEPYNDAAGAQAIRTPRDILGAKAATCLDSACLFASLLMAAKLPPFIVLLAGKRFGHALVGYRAASAPGWSAAPSLGDLRLALQLGDAVVFETTGAFQSEESVGVEGKDARRIGKGVLTFEAAQQAATDMLRSDPQLMAVVDLSSPQ